MTVSDPEFLGFALGGLAVYGNLRAPGARRGFLAAMNLGLLLWLAGDPAGLGPMALFLALGYEDQVHRCLLPGSANRVQGSQECRFRTLLVDCATAHDDLADARLVDDPRLQRWRAPFGRVELLDVVHEIEPDGLLRSGIQGGEHAGLAVGLENFDFLESGIARQLRHVLDTFA